MSTERRIPNDAETEDYPNLIVCSHRQTGQITVDRSRLPLNSVLGTALAHGWDEVVACWDYIETDYQFTRSDLAGFLYDLLDVRHEWARLLCVMADVERRPRPRKADTERLRVALIDCLATLQPPASSRSENT